MRSWKTSHKNRKRKEWRAMRERLRARLEAYDRANQKPSPEATGTYECLCGNTRDFIGVDANGYGGPSECTNAPECSEDICEEFTELRQPLTIIEGEVNYAAFTGGGEDAEIGQYTSILCAKCNQVIWKEGDTIADPPAPKSPARRLGDLPEVCFQLLDGLRATYKNAFRLHWTGSKIPRGAAIDGKPITWTQHGIVSGGELVGEQLGYYHRLEEWSGTNRDEHEMLISTDGIVTTPADRPDMIVEQIRVDMKLDRKDGMESRS